MKRADVKEPGWMQAKLTEEYIHQGLRVAKQLRDAAARIERHAVTVPVDRVTGLPDHNRSAFGILGEINSFHGNLSTSNLLTAAADADRYARNPEGS